MTRPYDLTTYDGKRVDRLTRAALEDTAAALGYDLTLTQGSYNAGGVSASAGTHDGGGVVDLAAWHADEKVAALRAHGFAAWHRHAIPGLWPEHVHAVLIGNRKLAPAAARQVTAYLNGRNGLADNGPDDGPRQYVDVRYRWKRGARRIGRARTAIDRALVELRAYHPGTPGVRGYGVAAARAALRKAKANLPTTTTTA